MEQTKNEPTKENKAAPETGKPKKEREPLTEAQRLKRQCRLFKEPAPGDDRSGFRDMHHTVIAHLRERLGECILPGGSAFRAACCGFRLRSARGMVVGSGDDHFAQGNAHGKENPPRVETERAVFLFLEGALIISE